MESRLVECISENIIGVVGISPFAERINLTTDSQSLDDIILNYFETSIEKRLNLNPFVELNDGTIYHYQRGFVWSLSDKQSLIQSVYDRVELGRLVVRNRSYEWYISNKNKYKDLSYKDLVDGKQRLLTLISFVKNDFADSNGYYFSDLSEQSKIEFLDTKIAITNLFEYCDDKSTLLSFLRSNAGGVPKDAKHLDEIASLIKVISVTN